MSKYKTIAFDLDGTLTDPEHGLIEGFIYAFKKRGVTEYGDRDSLRRFIGPSLYKVWQEEFGFNHDSVIDAIEKFREYQKTERDYLDAKEILEDALDSDMRELANEEYKTCQKMLEALLEELKILLLPRDPNDDKNVMVESIKTSSKNSL